LLFLFFYGWRWLAFYTMHKLTAFPLGNADTTRIDLANGKKLLIDYANVSDPANKADKRIDLKNELTKDLTDAKRDYFDIVAFSHLDKDHICGSTEFFYFEHSTKLQGTGRIKMTELWVPAAVLVEEECSGDAKTIQDEARHRFKAGKGIRVFSNPLTLTKWLNDNKINDEAHRKLITDAGQLIPGLTLAADDVEFFLHSPHATRTADGTLLDRNSDAMAVQATFQEKHPSTGVIKKSRVHLFTDIDHCIIDEIVNITEYHADKIRKGSTHLERLWWDVMHLPHHSSYLSLSEDKGKDITVPDEEVKRLYETYAQANAIIISSSDVIPTEDTKLPPHRQAAAYYKTLNAKNKVEYKVTMEQPTKESPKPMVLKIDYLGVTIEKADIAGAPAILTKPTPRAGSTR
jgi:hypothetical protein